jgi:hypothetical protein
MAAADAAGRSDAAVLAAKLLFAVAFVFLARPASGAEVEYRIRIRDHQFVPAETRIPTGRKVRIVIENEDDSAEEFDSHSLNREKHIPPRASITLFIGPLDAGRYIFEGESDGQHGGAALGVLVAE